MKNIHLPKKVDSRLAEIFGIIVGDGYIRTRKPWWVSVEGGKEEKDYIDQRVAPLFREVFKIDFTVRFFDRHGKKNDDYGILIDSEKLVNFFKPFGLVTSHDYIEVPKVILGNKNLWTHFLRGYFDTDGHISFFTHNGVYNSYPRISSNTISKKLSNQVAFMLRNSGFRVSCWSRIPKGGRRKRIYICEMKGKTNLKKWFSEIGFKNYCKISRYLVWKKYGFCPSFTTIEERRNLLLGKLEVSSLMYRRPPWQAKCSQRFKAC